MMHARIALAVCTHLDHPPVESGPLGGLSTASSADLFTTYGEDQHAD
jgi:hypothetical protein